jgi:DNA-directed RNA polymerase specialized sigma24 family protein
VGPWRTTRPSGRCSARRCFEDLTERQTAEVLGIGVGTVKSQARDALARLRERLPWLEAGEVPTTVRP